MAIGPNMLNKQPKIKYTPLQVMDLEFIARAIYSFPDSNQAKERPKFLHPIKSADSESTHGSGVQVPWWYDHLHSASETHLFFCTPVKEQWHQIIMHLVSTKIFQIMQWAWGRTLDLANNSCMLPISTLRKKNCTLTVSSRAWASGCFSKWSRTGWGKTRNL